jgi:lysylphosphatidylglycerol synthetase-like protein (DUF2156 family)
LIANPSFATSFTVPPTQRIGGLATAASIMCGVSALGLVLTAVLHGTSRADANAYLNGELSDSEFISAVTPYALVTFIQSVSVLATVVLVIVWMYRIAANLRKLGRSGTWGPGWAIGGWFLPPMLYVIPLLMFRELWHASDPSTPLGANWRSKRFHPVLIAWFVLYSVAPLVMLVNTGDQSLASIGGAERELAEHIAGSSTTTWLTAAIGVGGAAAFIAWCRMLTARHQRLTGEVIG